MTILIKNGRVINPATGTDETLDVLVENGIVARTEKSIKEKCDRVIDAKGCFVMPGFIDMHVHLRDPGFEQKETIETGARAAVHGGFTTILAMPNTKPVVDNPDVVNYVHNKAKTVGAANVLQVGAVTKGQQGKELSVFNIFMIRNFMKSIPKALDEAATIDGATSFQVYTRIILPSIAPVMIVVGLFAFNGSWNDYLWPRIVMTDVNNQTLTAGLRLLMGQYEQRWAHMIASCLVSMVPPFLLYLCAQKYFLQGISVQAGVKG